MASARSGINRLSATGFALLLLVAAPTWSRADGLPEKYDRGDLKALEAAFVTLAEQASPSVVSVMAYRAAQPAVKDHPQVLQPLEHGSGFVLDAAGFIATNRHVVARADVVSVVLANGERVPASVVQTDPRSDLAVLRLEEPVDLKAATLGDAETLRVSQWVFAAGNPYGLANLDGRPSVTYGVVSALGRQLSEQLADPAGGEYYGNLIETSAAISPGNSGGPLFNIDGEVVGVVTALETSSGAHHGRGFAVPIDRNTKRVLQTLQRGEVVRYGFLGVEVIPAPPPAIRRAWNAPRGAQIREISVSDGPAARAGLRARDIILEYNGVPVEGPDHLVRLVGFTPVGSESKLLYLRDNEQRTSTVTIGDRESLLARRSPDPTSR